MYQKYYFLVLLVLMVSGCTMPVKQQSSTLIKVIHEDEYGQNETKSDNINHVKTMGKIEPVAYEDEKTQRKRALQKKAIFQYTLQETNP